jgi:hypothetical protein
LAGWVGQRLCTLMLALVISIIGEAMAPSRVALVFGAPPNKKKAPVTKNVEMASSGIVTAPLAGLRLFGAAAAGCWAGQAWGTP